MYQARRRVLLNVVLHACDISNPCKRWTLSHEWSNRISKEFFNQGDREREEGLPVSPNMDKATADQCDTSINFIDFIVGPMFAAVRRLLPKTEICVSGLQSNRNVWYQRLEKKNSNSKGVLNEEDAQAHRKKWEARNDAFSEILATARKQADEARPQGSPSPIQTIFSLPASPSHSSRSPSPSSRSGVNEGKSQTHSKRNTTVIKNRK